MPKQTLWAKRPIIFWASIAISLLLLSLQLLRWPLTEILTVFLEPILELVVGIAFIVVAIAAIVYGVRKRKAAGAGAWLPFMICFAATLALIFLPFNSLYLKFNFNRYKSRRTTAAQQIWQAVMANWFVQGAEEISSCCRRQNAYYQPAVARSW